MYLKLQICSGLNANAWQWQTWSSWWPSQRAFMDESPPKHTKFIQIWSNRELKNHDEVHDDDVYWLGKTGTRTSVSVGIGGRRVHWM